MVTLITTAATPLLGTPPRPVIWIVLSVFAASAVHADVGHNPTAGETLVATMRVGARLV